MQLEQAKRILERRGFKIEIINGELTFVGAHEAHEMMSINRCIKFTQDDPIELTCELTRLMTEMGFEVYVRKTRLCASIRV